MCKWNVLFVGKVGKISPFPHEDIHNTLKVSEIDKPRAI
jgi:hypothetical protein